MENIPFTLAAIGVFLLMVVASSDIRPCASETDTWCYWDAQQHGGTESFVRTWGN